MMKLRHGVFAIVIYMTLGLLCLAKAELKPCTKCPKPLPFEDLFSYLSKNATKDAFKTSAAGLNPMIHPENWVALGDSYAAGPGAGDAVKDDFPDCMRGKNAYPFLMQKDNSMPGPQIGIEPIFTFKACTGDQTSHMLDDKNKNYQLGAVGDSVDFVTLSIGGNDVQFSAILKSCVFGLSTTKCDKMLEQSREILYKGEFYKQYRNVLQGILNRMKWTSHKDDATTAIYQTGYAQFFDVYTKQCDSAGFLLGDVGIGPKMTQKLRSQMNRLTHEVNYVLQYWIDLYNAENTVSNNFHLFTAPVHFVNADMYFNKHRFCREGVEEPDADNKETWFFHMSGKESAVQSQEEKKELVEKYYAEPITTTTPEWIVKTFHPTSRGFESTKDTIMSKFFYKEIARKVANDVTNFPLMVVGDYVAYASQDPNSDIYQGFIPHLRAIFGDYRFYGYPEPNSLKKLRPAFIGRRRAYNWHGDNHECWQSATLKQLANKLQDAPAHRQQGKVVILMAGTIDVMYGTDLNDMEDYVMDIIDAILELDPTAVILVGQIPIIGLPKHTDGAIWTKLSRRIVSYNAMLAELANYYVTKELGTVRIVHTSATPLEHDRDLILPTPDGYRRMAHDFAEAIVYAGARDMIKGSEIPIQNPTKRNPATPIPRDDKDEAIRFRCFAREDYKVKQGTKEEIRASFLNHLKIDEYIEKVACNRTEICKLSKDGVHGDKFQPSLLSKDATECGGMGGKPGKPDHNYIQIFMPKPDYNLAKSECGKIIKDILDECVNKQNAIGGGSNSKDGLRITLQSGYLDRKSTELRDYEADFFDNDDVLALLESDVALPARKNG